MWIYEKRLQFPVNIKETNAKLKENNARQKALQKELTEIKSSKFYKMKVKYDAIKNKFR